MSTYNTYSCVIAGARAVNGDMSSKGVYTAKLLVASVAFGVLGYVVRLPPLLPLSIETKTSLGYPRESVLNVTERVMRHGFSASEYSAVTEDGYILQLFRIRKDRTSGLPVLVMHGLLQSADSWVEAGPDAGLAYLLAAAGYDVWLGNTRGSYYSRRHKTFNPDVDPEFWNFSVDEIGRYDLPALVDTVLDNAAVDKLAYVGFSQGAGTYFVMCSELPHYCDKATIAITLAPAARQTYTRSVTYRMIAETMASTEGMLNSFGVAEVFAKGALGQEFLAFFCQLSQFTANMCEAGKDLLDSLDSRHPGSIKNETLRSLFGHFPAGTSLRNMARYGQSMRSKHFQKFDYGVERNMLVYGSEQPPKYNLSAVNIPVVAIYGRNDGMVDPKDVKWLLQRLPKVLEAVEVKDPLWNHLDVTYSQYTGDMIYPKVDEYLKKYSLPQR